MSSPQQRWRARLKPEFADLPDYRHLRLTTVYLATAHPMHHEWMWVVDDRGDRILAARPHFTLETAG